MFVLNNSQHEVMKLNGELTRTKAAKLKLESNQETLQTFFEKTMSELNSRRNEATRITLEVIEIGMKEEELNDLSAELTAKESRLTTLGAELALLQDFYDFRLREINKEYKTKI